MERSGGIEGNAALTSAAAVVLVALLLAEGVTIIDMGGLRTPHMVIGLVLIPPILVKLGSTGYRFARYYTHAREYVAKGPPLTWLPLLALGHRSDTLIELHKVSFIVWGVVFGLHFLGHLAEMARSLTRDWRLPGTGARIALVGSSILAGAAIGLSLLPPINAWHGGHHHHHG